MSKKHERNNLNEEKTEETETLQAEELTETEEKEIPEETSADEIKALTEENEKLRKEIEETKNDYLRARADCENVRKRTSAEIAKAYDDGRLEAVT